MALQSKSITANGAKGHHKFTLKITEESTNISKNTSAISWSFVLSPVSSGYDWSYSSTVPVSYTVTINGTKYTGDIMSYNGSSTVTIRSGTATITHDADGDKSISFSFSVTSLNVSYLPGSASKSGTMDLTNIPRQATLLTATDFHENKNPTITYSNPAGSAVSKLQAGIFTTDGKHAYVSYRDISKTGSSYTFELTSTEKNALLSACADSNSLNLRFYIKTTIGDNSYLHYLSRTFRINDANPIVTGFVEDINDITIALTGDKNKLIKYYSNALATMDAEAQKGATLDETCLYIIKNGSNIAYGTTYTFNNVESNEFTFSAEDSRGNEGTDTVIPAMVDYVKLTCNISNNRPDADGDMLVSCSGNYFNGSFGAVSNTLTVQYRYKVYGGTFSDWVNMNITLNGNTYYASASLTGLDYTKLYSFETRAIDKLATIPSTESTVKSLPLFHWGENDFVFEVPVTFNKGTTSGGVGNEVDGDLKVTGDLWLKGSGNYGNTLHFGDKSYVSISESQDDVLTIKATAVSFDTLAFGIYGNSINDFVVTEGKSGSWNYRMWYSGVAECWITISLSTAVNTAWGSLYRSGYTSQLDYPIEFISRPREIASVSCASAYGAMLESYIVNTSGKTGTYAVVRPAALTTECSFYFDIFVIGKWK